MKIASLLPVPENLALTVAIVIIVIILICTAVYLLRRSRNAGRTMYHEEEQPDFDYHSAIGTAPVPVQSSSHALKPAPKSVSTKPAQGTKKTPQSIPASVMEGRDITECFGLLTRKFSLDSFTLATCDGLVFASSGGGNVPADAARYSEIFCNDPLSETPGVTLFGMDHSGSSLVGIIRTPQEIPRNVLDAIENDTKAILNRWI